LLEVRDTARGPTFSSPGVDLHVEPRAADSFTLRILPLGASITEGYKSSDGTGFRKALRAQLRHAGWSVNMVGSVTSGAMSDKVSLSHPLKSSALAALKFIHCRGLEFRQIDQIGLT
jgi:hypothetical protein